MSTTETGQETPAEGEVQQQAIAPENATPQEAGTETPTEKETPQAAKSYTQDEVNDLVKRAKAAAESKTERRVLRTLETLQARQQSPVQQQTSEAPARQDGESDAQYVRRLVDQELQTRTQAERMQSVAKKTDDFYAKAEKIEGFDREVFDSLPLTPAIAQTLADSDPEIGPKIMAYLCENPQEAERISKLSAARQAAELGKLEDRVATESKPKAKAPSAPAPISPIGGGKSPVTDLGRMSAAEYYEARMKQKPVWAR